MSEETKVEVAAVDADTVEAAEDTEIVEATPADPTPSKKRKKWPIVVGIVAVVLVAAGAGFWVWHEQPSFCAAICHTPMDEYLVTYDQEPNTAGVDKYGNDVTNTSAMLAVSHKATEDSVDCLGCHTPTLSEQISEGIAWVSGDYEYPLYERTMKDLGEAQELVDDEFCLNEDCHNITRDDLVATTDHFEYNPHKAQHGKNECDKCHKAHRASVMYCTQCHSGAEVPDGWLTAAESAKLLA